MNASASTRLPLLVYHLNVSSYQSGTLRSIALMVSGAPFTQASVLLLCNIETVDIRFRAEENWNLRRMVMLALWAATALAASSPDGMGRTLSEDLSCQPSASRVVFSIGSPTIIPSSSRTRACAAARTCRVSGPTSFKSTRRSGLEGLKTYVQWDGKTSEG